MGLRSAASFVFALACSGPSSDDDVAPGDTDRADTDADADADTDADTDADADSDPNSDTGAASNARADETAIDSCADAGHGRIRGCA